MAIYFMNCDLADDRDYQGLFDELAENFQAVRILDTLWGFKRFDTTSTELRDYFKGFAAPDDGLVISEVTDWALFNFIDDPNRLEEA